GLSGSYEEPASPSERRLARVWSEVLGLSRVGRHDNFFDLGGNSIRLLAVLATLRERGEDGGVGLVELFRHPTVAALAARLEGGARADHGESRRRGLLRRERLAARRNAQRGDNE
ncbi:hypothetical protein ITP53_55235, partial [Nonomuraea sp. K274]